MEKIFLAERESKRCMLNLISGRLTNEDRNELRNLLSHISAFTEADQNLALELANISLEQPSQKDYNFVLARNENGSLAGYACYGPTPLTEGTYDLYWIAVNPELAHHSVGTMLLQRVEEEIIKNDGRMVVIETTSTQVYNSAQHFYLKNGYVLAEKLQDFYRPGEDRLTYVKVLRH
jgi:ribosomal protein S18 acetylase RimI-like enzyme